MIDLCQILLEDSQHVLAVQNNFLNQRHEALNQLSSLIAGQITPFGATGLLPLFDSYKLGQFATGSIVECFGPEFAKYEGRRFPRVPNGELALISRVTAIEGEKGNFTSPAWIECEYDVPQNAWFLEENNSPEIPYSILMEIALQPCGFISAFLGSPLIFPERDLLFRNLDGQGKLLARVDERGQTVHSRAVLNSTLVSGGTIIQRFEFELSCRGHTIFSGNSVFGYFTPEAMAKQAGLDNGRQSQPAMAAGLDSGKGNSHIDLRSATAQSTYLQAQPERAGYRLPGGHLRLFDELFLSRSGGKHHQGSIFARKQVDSQDWFYRCHFYQDPVMPGSLGIEAILQSLESYALHFDLGNGLKSPRFIIPTGTNLAWRYRGQIVQTNRLMQLEVNLTRTVRTIDGLLIEGNASLWADNLRIYEVEGLRIGLVEAL